MRTKTLKKFISALVALSTLLCCLTLTPAANAAKDYSKEISFVTAIGVEGFMSDTQAQELTRGAFAKALAQALKMDAEAETAQQRYSDVPDTHDAYKAISYLSRRNIMHGYEDGTFAPDKAISYNEGIKTALLALGYGGYAEVSGGIYVGYEQTADDIDLSFAAADQAALTKGEGAYIIYKTLFSNYVVAAKEGLSMGYKESDETLLKKLYDADEAVGIVTGTKMGVLYGEKPDEETAIDIDYKSYTTSMKKINDYLGMKVKYYYTEDGELLYLERHKQVTSTTVMYDDILPATTKQQVVADNGSGREKTYKLSGNALFVYNGKPLLAPTDNDLKPTYGELKLIDNDNDGKIDVVIIWSYKSYVVKTANNRKLLLRDNSDNVANIEIEDDTLEFNFFYSSGSSYIAKNLIDTGNAVSYAVSKDGELVSLFIQSGELEGKLSSYSKARQTAKIDDEAYDVMPGLDLSGVQGREATFYTDKNGVVVGYSTYDEMQEGLLTSMRYDDETEEIYLKILTESGFQRYKVIKDSKVKYCTGNEKTYNKKEPIDLYNFMLDGGTEVKKQFIKYKLNADGESISAIIVAVDQSDPSSANYDKIPTTEEEEDTLRLSFRYTSDKNDCKIYRQVLTLGSSKPSTKSELLVHSRLTKVICVSDDEDLCDFLYLDEFQTSENTYLGSFDAYGRTRLGWYEYIIVNMDGGNTAEKIDNNSGWKRFAVNRVVNEWDEAKEEEIYRLEGYSSTSGGKALFADTLEKDGSDEMKNTEISNTHADARKHRYAVGSIAWEDLDAGDVILCNTNALTGRVTAFGVICRKDDLKNDYSNNDFNSASGILFINGKVTAVDTYAIRLKATGAEGIVDSTDGGNERTLIRGYGGSTGDRGEKFDKALFGGVVKWNSKTETFTEAAWEDISVGDRVLAQRAGTYQHDRGMYIIIE